MTSTSFPSQLLQLRHMCSYEPGELRSLLLLTLSGACNLEPCRLGEASRLVNSEAALIINPEDAWMQGCGMSLVDYCMMPHTSPSQWV